MFTYQEATRTFWFSHLSIELESEYELVGSVLGLAIYNGVILDVHFPPVLYKKLLAGKPDFQVCCTAAATAAAAAAAASTAACGLIPIRTAVSDALRVS